MEVDEVEVIEMELKYCERCGGLWLRLCGSQRVYCGPCTEKHGESRNKARGSREEIMSESAFSDVALLCEKGGNA
jgi:Zn-finger nucleic acid-binding protein